MRSLITLSALTLGGIGRNTVIDHVRTDREQLTLDAAEDRPVDEAGPEAVVETRYPHINDFELLLTQSRTIVLKFFLNVSRSQQRQRFLERPAGRLAEVSPATLGVLGANLPAGGGAYFRLLPYGLLRAALRQAAGMSQRARPRSI